MEVSNPNVPRRRWEKALKVIVAKGTREPSPDSLFTLNRNVWKSRFLVRNILVPINVNNGMYIIFVCLADIM